MSERMCWAHAVLADHAVGKLGLTEQENRPRSRSCYKTKSLCGAVITWLTILFWDNNRLTFFICSHWALLLGNHYYSGRNQSFMTSKKFTFFVYAYIASLSYQSDLTKFFNNSPNAYNCWESLGDFLKTSSRKSKCSRIEFHEDG